MFLKRSWVYFLIIIFCIAGYFVSKSVISKRLIEKQITYTSSTASVVYMAWGFSSGSVPSSNVWPKYSFEKDGMIYTPLASRNKTFFTSLKLKAGTEIYYWMVQKKDTSGNETDIWDAGGQYKKQFRLTFSDDGFFRPGYFIFLAGFLPLLIYYLRNRKIQNRGPSGKIFTVKDYIPQFDSIRAIAVLMVIIHHWYSKNRVLNFLANGPMGVNIFFVLSGFLITGILLKAKQQVDEKRLKRAEIFKNFISGEH